MNSISSRKNLTSQFNVISLSIKELISYNLRGRFNRLLNLDLVCQRIIFQNS